MDDQAYSSPASRFPAGKRELRFGLAMLLCSVFLWNSILYAGFSLGFSLGALAVMGCSVWYLISSGCRFDLYSTALLVFSGLIIAGFARSSDGFVKFVMLLFLLFAVNLSFCLAAGQNRRSPKGPGSVLDALRAFFTLGAGNMRASALGLNDARKDAEAAGKKGGAAVLGLLIAVPVAAVLIFLLMRADAAFEGLMDLLPDMDWSEPVWSLLLGAFAAWILYSQGLGLRFSDKEETKKRTFQGISAVTVNTILAAVCLIYCVYLLSQLAYLGGGFSGILPEAYTLAQYARRGFFEMAWLSAINLGLMCLAMGLVEQKAPGLTKGLCLFLGMVTLFLIAAASAKMLLYIGNYGLTRLRVLTEVVMVWLAVTTVLVCVWLFRPGFPYMKAVVITALALGTLVFWMDVDTQVARYNVRSYQDGWLETVDMGHLSSLGYGAVPYLAELANDADPEVAQTAKDILTCEYCRIKDFRDWNYSKAAAEKILQHYQEQAEVLPG
ncbi:MAG: DUF4153 domain-containing protein [Faecousia sp.]